jgi:hypothetical protein
MIDEQWQQRIDAAWRRQCEKTAERHGMTVEELEALTRDESLFRLWSMWATPPVYDEGEEERR